MPLYQGIARTISPHAHQYVQLDLETSIKQTSEQNWKTTKSAGQAHINASNTPLLAILQACHRQVHTGSKEPRKRFCARSLC